MAATNIEAEGRNMWVSHDRSLEVPYASQRVTIRFRSGKDWYAGSFSLLGEEDDTRVFAFARLEANGKHHFFRYNYNTDKVELTDSFGEHSYMYLRIINLQEAPSFFKPMPD